MSQHSPNTNPDSPATYVIQVRGRLGPQWDDWFEGMAVAQNDAGDTIITGTVADQAALHGLLRRIRDLGLALISVIRIDNGDGDPSSSTPEDLP